MRLVEYEGKALLAARGVAIPHGLVFGPGAVPPAGPSVVKVQVARGKRGKGGGIVMAPDAAAASDAARAFLNSGFNGRPVCAVLVEERLAIAREFYISLIVDRGTAQPALLASREGGMDIELVPDESIVRVDLDRSIGVRDYHVRALARALGLETQARELGTLLRAMWDILIHERAIVVEINPVVLTHGGRLIAADAKIELDARSHPERTVLDDDRTGYERAVAPYDAVGVQMDGRIAVVASGAGVLMATADSLCKRGGSIAGILDLGGFPRALEVETKLFAATLMLRPVVVFFNFFTQFMRCDQFARAIVAAFAERSDVTIVARMKGAGADEAHRILDAAGMTVTESYARACEIAIAASQRVASR